MRLLCPLLLVSVLLPGCARDASTDARANALLLAGEAFDSGPGTLVAQQRRLFRALADSAAPAAEMLSVNFTFHDVDAPPPPPPSRSAIGLEPGLRIIRHPSGMPGAQSYFQALNAAFVQHSPDSMAMQVRSLGPNYAWVIAYPPSGKPIITLWQKLGEQWRAERMSINVPHESITRMQRSYSVVRSR